MLFSPSLSSAKAATTKLQLPLQLRTLITSNHKVLSLLSLGCEKTKIKRWGTMSEAGGHGTITQAGLKAVQPCLSPQVLALRPPYIFGGKQRSFSNGFKYFRSRVSFRHPFLILSSPLLFLLILQSSPSPSSAATLGSRPALSTSRQVPLASPWLGASCFSDLHPRSHQAAATALNRGTQASGAAHGSSEKVNTQQGLPGAAVRLDLSSRCPNTEHQLGQSCGTWDSIVGLRAARHQPEALPSLAAREALFSETP